MLNTWQDFLDIVRKEVGSRVVETWFKAIVFERWASESRVAYLVAPNAFVRDWVKQHYMPLLQLHLGRLLHTENPTITISVHTAGQETSAELVSQESRVTIIPASIIQEKNSLAKRDSNRTHINKTYSFDNFIVGPSNSLAYAAAHAVTENPGTLYNPLLIYGKSGLGKTHLMHAIGNEIKNRYNDVVILYQTADRFVTEFISAIRFNKVHQFQQRYHNIDVLLVDDMQFISKKEHTQEAFFHIFNSLYEAGKQLVFTSDTYPDNLQGIADRLRSRLSSGLVTDIDEPALETKIAILKKKAALNDEQLDDEVSQYIAMQGGSNIRELEGLLIRVLAFSALTKQPITSELAKKVLARTTAQAPIQKAIDFEKIIHHVTKQSGYTLQDLCSKSRHKDISQMRHVAMFLMKKLTNKSLRDIGTYLGGRDHSTIMHGLAKVHAQLQEEKGLQDTVKILETSICGS